MLVRKAQIQDLKLLSELFDGYRVFYKKTSDLEVAKEFIRERLEKEDSEIFVAENTETQLMGFTQLYPLFSSTKMKRLWLLNDLFVNPDFRGKGISIQLINKAKELVRNTDACGMYLETGSLI